MTPCLSVGLSHSENLCEDQSELLFQVPGSPYSAESPNQVGAFTPRFTSKSRTRGFSGNLPSEAEWPPLVKLQDGWALSLLPNTGEGLSGPTEGFMCVGSPPAPQTDLPPLARRGVPQRLGLGESPGGSGCWVTGALVPQERWGLQLRGSHSQTPLVPHRGKAHAGGGPAS